MALSREPWQLGYATTSVEGAVDVFARQYDAPAFLVRDPATVEVSSPTGDFTMALRLAFAFVGGVNVELIEPLEDERRIYTSILPAAGFGLQLHHLGYRLDSSPAAWTTFRDDVTDAEILFEGAVAEHTRFAYLDTRAELGHHLEFLWWDEDRSRWLETVPHN